MSSEGVGLNADSSEDEILPSKSSQLNADSSEDEVPVGKSGNVRSEDGSDNAGALQSSDEEEVNKSQKVRRQARVVSDDSSDQDKEKVPGSRNVSENDSPRSSPGGKKKKKKSKIRKAVMSDEDSDDQSQSQPVSSLLKNKDLYDAESSDEELPDIPRYSKETDESGAEDSNKEDVESLDDIKNSVVEKHKRGGERKSAQAAMMEIRSESARMTRESAIGLPYHRPKQRSLAEFLNRKSGTPDAVKSINVKRYDSNIDKVMAERENKIKDFFKADSEEENAADDEEDEDDKDYNPNAVEDTPVAVPEKILADSDQDVPKDTSEDNHDHNPPEKDIDEASVDMLDSAQDSGVFSCPVTSEDSNVNTEEEKSGPNSPAPDSQLSPQTIKDNEKEEVNDSGDSLRLELTETEEITATETETVPEGEGEESLKLVLETETLHLEEDDEIPSSQTKLKPVNKAWARLQAIKNKIGDVSDIGNTLSVTPKIGLNPDNEDLVICEADSDRNVSKGAQKLIEKFLSHAKAGVSSTAENVEVENVKIVTKKTVDGKEVLREEVVQYKNDGSAKKNQMRAGTSYINYKANLKRQMMAKKKAEVEHKREIMKMNNEEGFEDELPEDEIVEDEELLDEEYEYDEESEPEEEDIVYQDKKRKKSRYIDDEAEDEDESDGGDDESDDNESVITFDDSSKKTQFRKIIQEPELMSENSNQSDSVFARLDRIRCDTETPTLSTSGKQTSAPSSNSSIGAFVLAEPRWTPFQDRTNNQSLASSDNTVTSPTQSQLAKKKLGFEGLFDSTDPDVTGIDDVIGLCSGQFATQTQSGQFATQTQGGQLETQDTVILTATGHSRPVSRAENENSLQTQEDTLILAGTQTAQKLNASINNILQDLGENDERIGHGVIDSDEDDEQSELLKPLKVRKKRKGRLVSDSEESDDDDSNENEKEEVNEEPEELEERSYDSEENEILVPKKVKQKLFTKGGKLRQDFYDIEAELSDEEGRGPGVSDDEDEKDLDRLEMEEGDMDDIDEDEEREKVGRIHQRVLLDEDQADLRLFQERFLEDGDLHTDYKRQRQFKWNGLDDNIEVRLGNIYLNSKSVSQVGPAKEEEGEGEEEESLEKWRLSKMEKDLWQQV